MTRDARAVLFDMDGVIVDSEVYWHEFEKSRILPAVLDEGTDTDTDSNGDGGERPDVEETTGMNFREIYDYLDANYDVAVEKSEFVDIYERTAREIYTERVTLMDGFRELCADLREAGATTGIVSSSPRAWISLVRERFGLDVDTVVSAEDIDGLGKPEPAVYEHAAAVIGVEPDECVVVEDSANGTRAAARAGAAVIGYRGEANADHALPAADVVVSGPKVLRAEFRRRLEPDLERGGRSTSNSDA
jgi:HAD superfamily hydrolase (TIGR01509 family)